MRLPAGRFRVVRAQGFVWRKRLPVPHDTGYYTSAIGCAQQAGTHNIYLCLSLFYTEIRWESHALIHIKMSGYGIKGSKTPQRSSRWVTRTQRRFAEPSAVGLLYWCSMNCKPINGMSDREC